MRHSFPQAPIGIIIIFVLSIVVAVIISIIERIDRKYKKEHYTQADWDREAEQMESLRLEQKRRQESIEWWKQHAKESRARQDAILFRNVPKYEPEYKKRERERRARECPVCGYDRSDCDCDHDDYDCDH